MTSFKMRKPRGRGRGEKPWHALPIEDVFERLGSGPDGLDPALARRRLAAVGPNLLDELPPRSHLEILASQLANLPSALLLGSAGLSALLRDFVDAGAIATVLGLNSAIGYEVERESEELLTSWRTLEAGAASVIRGARLDTVAAGTLVPGDVFLCRAGDLVPADARVIDAHRLTCNEASLTGESEPQQKSPQPVAAGSPLAERVSMLHAGTWVSGGHGRAVVVSTGIGTEVARIHRLLSRESSPTPPLARRIEEVGDRFAWLGAATGAASALLGLVRGRPPREVLANAVALGVAAIPEGLPVVTTAALVRSMQRMRRRGMVVRRLSAAETLGGVSVICADKTGTLTQNAMRVEVVEIDGASIPIEKLRADPARVFEHAPTLALAAAVLNSDVDVQQVAQEKSVAGSSTEAALVRAAWNAGLSRSELRRLCPRRRLFERSDSARYVVSVHDAPFGPLAFVKGAPDQVLPMCTRDGKGALGAARRRRLLARNDALAERGLRVLAVAWRRLAPGKPPRLDGGYTLVGLIGLRDPLRPGAAETVAAARRAGIRTVILTGDQSRTAAAVARAVGLDGETIDGAELRRRMAKGDLGWLDRIAAVSRVSPADKVSVVRALRARGDVVAMAGDGVNDAPALKVADVGIAVGVRADDLARQSAQIVLEGEDLRSILAAVAEGRVVQDNLRRAVRYLLTTNLAEVLVVLGGTLAGVREPLNSRQILWINLLSDTLPALALALEPGDVDVLDRPPAPPDAPLLEPGAPARVLRDAAAIAAVTATAGLIGGRPVAFSTMVGAELGYAALCRADGAAASSRFQLLVGGGAALQVAALSLPPFRWLLGLPVVPSPLEIAGFGTGFLVPWIAGSAPGDGVVVREGRSRRRRPAAAAGRRSGAMATVL